MSVEQILGNARIVTAEAAIQAIERHQHELAETHGHAERYAEVYTRLTGDAAQRAVRTMLSRCTFSGSAA